MNENETYKYDTSVVYEYKEFPDKEAGICDNCGNKHFKSSVKNYKFTRECRNCGLKKNI